MMHYRHCTDMRTKLINIEIVRHRDTGMYLAFSDDMRGLYVHARTVRELDERIPVAIKAIYEAAGRPVTSVTVCDDGLEDVGFEPTRRSYRAEQRDAA